MVVVPVQVRASEMPSVVRLSGSEPAPSHQGKTDRSTVVLVDESARVEATIPAADSSYAYEVFGKTSTEKP